jgi:hypothetical protein
MRHRLSSSRRGLTFIEVVVATALLTSLASVVVGTVTFMENSVARQRYRLDAMEVAHRLVAQYLDDDKLLPQQSLPIQQGNAFYRYQLKEEVVMQDEADSTGLRRGRIKRQDEVSAEQALPQMLNRVTIAVYLDDPANPVIETSRPLAELSRMFNPVSGRDEDAMMRYLLKQVERFEREQGSRPKPSPGSGAPPK